MSLQMLSKNYRVSVVDADFTKKIKLSAVFNYFQEIAGLHAQKLRIGFDVMQNKANAAWVLAKMRIDFERYPVWEEEITVETWPLPPKKYEFERDFLIKDMNGNVVARAVSIWAIIDIGSRQLKKAEAISADWPEFITERAIDCRLGRLKPNGSLKIAYRRTIGCSDIDVNGHINNSKYVDFIMDCFSMEDIRKHQVRSIQVSYLNEAFAGETIEIYICKDESQENRVYIEGIDSEDKRIIFTASLDTKASL